MDLNDLFNKRGEVLPPPSSRPARPAYNYAPPTAKDEPVICEALPDPTKILSWDTETWKITAETGPVPPLVCVQTQVVEQVDGVWHEGNPTIWGADPDSKMQGVDFIFYVLEHRTDVSLISLNGFFDFAVILQHKGWPLNLIQLVFKAFREGRIRDCIARAKEHAVEFGWLEYDPSLGTRPKFDMEQLALKYLDESIKGKHGEESVRLRYREVDGVSCALWDYEFTRYALLDPQYTQRIWRAICIASTPPPDECMQTESAWQLYLATVNGCSVDPERVEVLRHKILPVITEGIKQLVQDEVYTPGKPSLNKKLFGEMLDAVFGGHALRTAKGAVSLTEKQLLAAYRLSGNPLFNPALTPGARLGLAAKWDEDQSDEEDDSEEEDPTETEDGEDSAASKLVLYSKPKKTMATIYAIVEKHFKERGLAVPLTKPKTRTDPNTGEDLTPDPRIKTSRDVIEQVPRLKPLADIGAAQKVDSMYLSPRKGQPALFSRPIVHSRWDHMKSTGRVAVSAPNLNNIPRMKGVRECFRARPGYVLISADYAQAELCSLAQVCIDKFGHSRMAELIIDGLDLHLYLVSKLRDQDYEWLVQNKKLPAVKNDRQGAKAANFGFPGGLGIDKFIKYAADTFGLMDMTRDEAEEWKNIWKAEYPEMPVYFRWISNKVKNGINEFFTAIQHRSGRRRGRVGYTDGCNTYFQGLTADGAKYAMNLIGREAWCEPDSPIFGFRLVAFIYDEIFGEMPDRGHVKNTLAAARLCQIMKEAMEVFTPDVPAKVEPAYQYNWSKGADPVWAKMDGQDVLLPWEHRGGEFITGAPNDLQIVKRPPVLDLTERTRELTTWDNRDYTKLVYFEEVPKEIQDMLKAA
jgi:DNA polymerase-1